MSGEKKPKVKSLPGNPRSPKGTPPVQTRHSWSFQILDHGHPKWCFSKPRSGKVAEVLKKLGAIEHLSFPELGQNGSHFVSVSSLKPEARDRLKYLGQDDVDEVYSIRFESISRVFAIYQYGIMKVLWLDTNHEICPSVPIQDRSDGKKR